MMTGRPPNWIFAFLVLLASGASAQTFDEAWNAYEVGDYDTALPILKQLADSGEPDAQFTLGRMYDHGLGVARDAATAAAWYVRAAERHHRAAEFALALKYDSGDGVTRDVARAVEWYRLSALHGYPGAQLNLGTKYATGAGVPKDPVRAYMWWSLAAEQGNLLARQNRDAIASSLSDAERARAAILAQESGG